MNYAMGSKLSDANKDLAQTQRAAERETVREGYLGIKRLQERPGCAPDTGQPDTGVGPMSARRRRYFLSLTDQGRQVLADEDAAVTVNT